MKEIKKTIKRMSEQVKKYYKKVQTELDMQRVNRTKKIFRKITYRFGTEQKCTCRVKNWANRSEYEPDKMQSETIAP